jgi:Trk K+ transport system NAD-binding subunit
MLSIIENLKVQENSMAQVCRRSELAKRLDKVVSRGVIAYSQDEKRLSEVQKLWETKIGD